MFAAFINVLLMRHHLDSQSWFHSQEVNVMIDSKVSKLQPDLASSPLTFA